MKRNASSQRKQWQYQEGSNKKTITGHISGESRAIINEYKTRKAWLAVWRYATRASSNRAIFMCAHGYGRVNWLANIIEAPNTKWRNEYDWVKGPRRQSMGYISIWYRIGMEWRRWNSEASKLRQACIQSFVGARWCKLAINECSDAIYHWQIYLQDNWIRFSSITQSVLQRDKYTLIRLHC